MSALASTRPIFHSEADFQHAFAWELHRQLPNASIRLERPLAIDGTSYHVDLIVQTSPVSVAIELKYKTRRLSAELADEVFRLADHSAQDAGRYDYIKDIQRLERIASHARFEGWAIFLTNDSSYWTPARAHPAADTEFRIAEGRLLTGSLGWGESASDGTKRDREARFDLQGRYTLSWKDYCKPVVTSSYGQFRYLAVNVIPPTFHSPSIPAAS